MTNGWVLIRTERRKELAVYAQTVDVAEDTWLPREPRFTRLARSRNQRQWWAPVLPGYFLARGVRLADVATIRHFDGIERDCDGTPIEVPEWVVSRFRAAIEADNRLIVRLAGIRCETARNVKRTISRRLKPRRAAARLRAVVESYVDKSKHRVYEPVPIV